MIPKLINQEDNSQLNKMPTVEEVRKVVFTLNGSSFSGLNGFTGLFYQVCWDIIVEDMMSVVIAFFQRMTLPKSITHTNLVLIPKKNKVTSFSRSQTYKL